MFENNAWYDKLPDENLEVYEPHLRLFFELMHERQLIWKRRFIDKKERKSIPYDFIKENGYKLDYNYLKGIDYIKAVDLMIKENV